MKGNGCSMSLHSSLETLAFTGHFELERAAFHGREVRKEHAQRVIELYDRH
jgi:hypothetical protein